MGSKPDIKDGIRKRYLQVFDDVKAELKIEEDKILCGRLGMPPQSFSHIRSGIRYPTLEQILNLCDTFKYDIVYVLKGTKTAPTKQPKGKITLDDIQRELQEIRAIVEQQSKRKQ